MTNPWEKKSRKRRDQFIYIELEISCADFFIWYISSDDFDIFFFWKILLDAC